MKESKELIMWRNEGELDIGRDYELFSILAGVRNAHDIVPISEPKGVPRDASNEFDSLYKARKGDAHSTSYLSLAELKKYDQNVELVDGYHCKRVNDLIAELEKLRVKRGLTDDDVRICFFFVD